MNDDSTLAPVPAPPPATPAQSRVRTVIGGGLMGIGILIAGGSGLCLIILTGDQLDHPDPLARNINSGLMTISGIVLIVGAGAITFGWYLLRKGKRDE